MPLAMLLKMPLAMLLMVHGATGMDLVTDTGMSIRVNLPDASSASSEGVPVVVFLHGTGVDPSWGDTALIAQSATQAGFAFALLEYPVWDGSDWPKDGTMSGEMYCNKSGEKADQLFGRGEKTSLSMVCALDGIDCSKGVGVAGYSQGAGIGSMAAKLDDRVTAFFAIGMNTLVMYSEVGWEETTCHRDATLPPSARRYLAGGDDEDSNPAQSGVDNLQRNKYQLPLQAGYNCGEQLDCLQDDGSGYFIVPGVNHYDIYAFYMKGWEQFIDENMMCCTGCPVCYTSTPLTDAVVQKTKEMAAYAPMMNGFVWLMGRTTTDAPGCPCPAGNRRKLLFGSMGHAGESAETPAPEPAPEAAASTCCVSF